MAGVADTGTLDVVTYDHENETLKLELLRKHMDRVMETVWAGPERVDTY